MLIDTSGFLCLYEKSDPFHSEAIEFYDNASKRTTTNYILAEYTALATIRGIGRDKIVAFSSDVLIDPLIEVIWIDERIHNDAVGLIAKRLDKEYSLCDAASFVVMNERGIIDALTTDRHFAQEGFVRLLQ